MKPRKFEKQQSITPDLSSGEKLTHAHTRNFSDWRKPFNPESAYDDLSFTSEQQTLESSNNNVKPAKEVETPSLSQLESDIEMEQSSTDSSELSKALGYGNIGVIQIPTRTKEG